jgi:hypothetical protein
MNPFPKRALAGGIALIVLGLAGALAWWHWRVPVARDDIAAFLSKSEGAGRLAFTVDSVAVLREQDGSLQLAVAATGRTAEPLYTKMEPADYLRRAYQLDQDATGDARHALADKGSAAAPGMTGQGPLPADPFEATILAAGSPPDSPFAFQGVIGARRTDGTWVLSLASGGLTGAGPTGDPRSSFAGPAFVAGDASDEARLKASVADFRAFAARVAKARQAADEARVAAADLRRQSFLGYISPGRVFRGRAREAGDQQGTTLYLEIADVTAANEVTALVRNEGSWHKARTFQGTWSADDDFKAPVLNLTSAPEQAVRNAGLILENTQTWTLALAVDAQGRMTQRDKLFQYDFQPIGPDAVSATNGRLEAEFNGANAAAEAGTLYHGSATSRATGASEPILLRFTQDADGGQSVAASLESTTRSWKRALTGRILENSRRSGGEPIRLGSAAADAAEDAPAESVLGDKEDLDLHLGLDGAALAGEDAQFTYRLEPAGERDLRRLEAARAQRARVFAGIFRDGIEYDGVMREEQGFISRARLEVGRVDPRTGAVAARIASLGRPGVRREFVGSCDPSGGSLTLFATERGRFDGSDAFDIPFLMAPTPATLHLVLTDGEVTGSIEGNPHWRIEFAASVFLSAPTETPGPDVQAAVGAQFPPLPFAEGAYLLSRGAWVALPKNNGHVVVVETKADAGDEAPSNIADAVAIGIQHLVKKREVIKTPYLRFDGKEPTPVSASPAMVICVVGTTLAGNVPAELAPTEVLKEGDRSVEIVLGPGAKVAIGDQREAAYVRRVDPSHVLLTTTAPLAPGPYALNAGGTYEVRQD